LAEVAAQNDETEDEALELVGRRFEHGWDALIEGCRTPHDATNVLDGALTSPPRYLARVLEKRIWSYAGGRASRTAQSHGTGL